MRDLRSILSPFSNKFNKFNKTGFYLSYEIKIILKSYFWREKTLGFYHLRDAKSVIT